MQTDEPTGASVLRTVSALKRLQPLLCRYVPAAAVFGFLAWCFISVRPDFSWDDADPEVLNQAWRLAKGEDIYRGINKPPFAFAAYTPLYYALTAVLMKFTGLSFLPAKALSFLSALCIAWALVRLNREWHGNANGGIWAACFLFLVPAFLYNVTRSNVQMMAVALSLWSLVFFLRDRWKETVLISPLLAVLAFYTKQSQVALPLAMAVYLAIRKRRWLIPYTAVLAAAGLVPYLWLQSITHGYFYFNTVQLAKLAYSALQIPPLFLRHAGPAAFFIGLALWISWRRFKSRSWDALDCYLVCALATTLFTLGRIGAHGQYVLELLVAAVLFLLRNTGLPRIRGREALVSVQILLLFCYTPSFIFLEEGIWDISANRSARKIYPMLKAGSGPILSQQGSFALFARDEIFVQLFHFSALSRAGLWDQSLLLREIDKHTFSYVITEFPLEQPVSAGTDRERFTPEVLKALRIHYERVDAAYPYHLYVPRFRQALESAPVPPLPRRDPK